MKDLLFSTIKKTTQQPSMKAMFDYKGIAQGAIVNRASTFLPNTQIFSRPASHDSQVNNDQAKGYYYGATHEEEQHDNRDMEYFSNDIRYSNASYSNATPHLASSYSSNQTVFSPLNQHGAVLNKALFSQSGREPVTTPVLNLHLQARFQWVSNQLTSSQRAWDSKDNAVSLISEVEKQKFQKEADLAMKATSDSLGSANQISTNEYGIDSASHLARGQKLTGVRKLPVSLLPAVLTDDHKKAALDLASLVAVNHTTVSVAKKDSKKLVNPINSILGTAISSRYDSISTAASEILNEGSVAEHNVGIDRDQDRARDNFVDIANGSMEVSENPDITDIESNHLADQGQVAYDASAAIAQSKMEEIIQKMMVGKIHKIATESISALTEEKQELEKARVEKMEKANEKVAEEENFKQQVCEQFKLFEAKNQRVEDDKDDNNQFFKSAIESLDEYIQKRFKAIRNADDAMIDSGVVLESAKLPSDVAGLFVRDGIAQLAPPASSEISRGINVLDVLFDVDVPPEAVSNDSPKSQDSEARKTATRMFLFDFLKVANFQDKSDLSDAKFEMVTKLLRCVKLDEEIGKKLAGEDGVKLHNYYNGMQLKMRPEFDIHNQAGIKGIQLILEAIDAPVKELSTQIMTEVEKEKAMYVAQSFLGQGSSNSSSRQIKSLTSQLSDKLEQREENISHVAKKSKEILQQYVTFFDHSEELQKESQRNSNNKNPQAFIEFVIEKARTSLLSCHGAPEDEYIYQIGGARAVDQTRDFVEFLKEWQQFCGAEFLVQSAHNSNGEQLNEIFVSEAWKGHKEKLAALIEAKSEFDNIREEDEERELTEEQKRHNVEFKKSFEQRLQSRILSKQKQRVEKSKQDEVFLIDELYDQLSIQDGSDSASKKAKKAMMAFLLLGKTEDDLEIKAGQGSITDWTHMLSQVLSEWGIFEGRLKFNLNQDQRNNLLDRMGDGELSKIRTIELIEDDTKTELKEEKVSLLTLLREPYKFELKEILDNGVWKNINFLLPAYSTKLMGDKAGKFTIANTMHAIKELKGIFELKQQLKLSGNFQLKNSEQAEYLLGLSEQEAIYINKFLVEHNECYKPEQGFDQKKLRNIIKFSSALSNYSDLRDEFPRLDQGIWEQLTKDGNLDILCGIVDKAKVYEGTENIENIDLTKKAAIQTRYKNCYKLLFRVCEAQQKDLKSVESIFANAQRIMKEPTGFAAETLFDARMSDVYQGINIEVLEYLFGEFSQGLLLNEDNLKNQLIESAKCQAVQDNYKAKLTIILQIRDRLSLKNVKAIDSYDSAVFANSGIELSDLSSFLKKQLEKCYVKARAEEQSAVDADSLKDALIAFILPGSSFIDLLREADDITIENNFKKLLNPNDQGQNIEPEFLLEVIFKASQAIDKKHQGKGKAEKTKKMKTFCLLLPKMHETLSGGCENWDYDFIINNLDSLDTIFLKTGGKLATFKQSKRLEGFKELLIKLLTRDEEGERANSSSEDKERSVQIIESYCKADISIGTEYRNPNRDNEYNMLQQIINLFRSNEGIYIKDKEVNEIFCRHIEKHSEGVRVAVDFFVQYRKNSQAGAEESSKCISNFKHIFSQDDSLKCSAAYYRYINKHIQESSQLDTIETAELETKLMLSKAQGLSSIQWLCYNAILGSKKVEQITLKVLDDPSIEDIIAQAPKYFETDAERLYEKQFALVIHRIYYSSSLIKSEPKPNSEQNSNSLVSNRRSKNRCFYIAMARATLLCNGDNDKIIYASQFLKGVGESLAPMTRDKESDYITGGIAQINTLVSIFKDNQAFVINDPKTLTYLQSVPNMGDLFAGGKIDSKKFAELPTRLNPNYDEDAMKEFYRIYLKQVYLYVCIANLHEGQTLVIKEIKEKLGSIDGGVDKIINEAKGRNPIEEFIEMLKKFFSLETYDAKRLKKCALSLGLTAELKRNEEKLKNEAAAKAA